MDNYNGVIFHRVIEDFMIQGMTQLELKVVASLIRTHFEDEFSREAFNLYGTLSMANAGPNIQTDRSPSLQQNKYPHKC